MKENYPALFAALQVEEMQMQEGGAFINEELLATLNSTIASLQEIANNHEQQIADMNAEHMSAVEKLNAEHAEAIAAQVALVEEKQNAITALEQEKADLQAALTMKDETIATMQSDMEGQAAQIEQLNTELNGAKDSLAKAEGIITERDQQIADLNAQVAELQNNPGEGAQAGYVENNGSGAEVAGVVISTQYVYDLEKSPEENRKARKEWEAAHK